MTIDAKRLELMSRGVEELKAWLLDMLREGLAPLAQAPPDYWEELAARMVDAKLGSIARRIRAWPALIALPDGEQKLIEEIAAQYLYIRAFQRIKQLEPARQMDLLINGGLNLKKEKVRQGKTFQDHWLVIGSQNGEEDNLRFRRTWLLGEKQGRMALLLDFAWGRNDFTENWLVGSVFVGELVFYPSNYPLRALVKSFEWSQKTYDLPVGFETADFLTAHYAKALAANPWLFSFPCLLNQYRLVRSDPNWFLIDKNRRQLALPPAGKANWKLLALSAGGPLTVFGEWDGKHFSPLSVIREQGIIAF